MNIPNYKILKEIGAGGMGTVYLAEHTLIKRKVAIKSLKQDLIKNEQLRERFKKEATALAQLEHPNIVRLNEYIEQQDGVFLIMEYVDGLPLDEHINNISGPINEEQLIPLFLQILDAFEYAHKNKIVHRDIKPSNFIITKDGKIKVLDFGIAKIMDETNSMTKTGTQMGSVLYMSPEQVRGEKVNHLSDIYSLGVTLFQMATGKAPYKPTSNEYEVFQKIDKESLPKASSIYPGISKKIEEIIERATNKNSSNRFQSCSEFKKVLSQKKNLKTTKVSVSETIINEPSPISKKKKIKKYWIFGIVTVILISINLYNSESKTKISLDKTTFKVDNNDIVYLKSNMKPLNGYLSCEYGIMGLYKDGKKEGVHKNWYSNGSLISEEEIINGANANISKKWNEQYQLIYKRSWTKNFDQTWYDNGQLKTEGYSRPVKYDSTKNWNPPSDALLVYGLCREWYENGQLKSEKNYNESGKPEGTHREWHENGAIILDCNYKNGELDGKYKESFPNGIDKKIAFYLNGKLNGYFKTYDDRWYSGDTTYYCQEGKYINNLKDSIWIEYEASYSNNSFQKGKITNKTKYLNGKKVVKPSKFIKIGNQYWHKQNLNVDYFSLTNDKIIEAQTKDYWKYAFDNKIPAWCYYNNNPENGKIYGKLYNWWAVSDNRCLCPKGTHVPTEKEWEILGEFLAKGWEKRSNYRDHGGKVKSKGTKENGSGLWKSPNSSATNSSGFNAKPSGARWCHDGSFHYLNEKAIFASNSLWFYKGEFIYNKPFCVVITYDSPSWQRTYKYYDASYTVRCIKD
jgi:uncharacterized protein (TIGR02145 family)